MYGGSDILDSDTEYECEETEDTYNKGSRLRKRILLYISQDITYGVNSGKIIPPMQYSLGLAAHQISGRNKRLVKYYEMQAQNFL